MNLRYFIKRGAKIVRKVAIKKAPEALTILGIGMGVTTVGLAVKQTYKTAEDIQQLKEELGEEPTHEEIVKATWKNYIPVVATGVASIVLIVGGNYVALRRSAVAVAACTVAERELRDYRESTRNNVDSETFDKIQGDFSSRNMSDTHNIIGATRTGRGEVLCYESITGRYFYSDPVDIERSFVRFNRRLLDEYELDLNDLFDELGLDSCSIGSDLGWSADEMNGNLVEYRLGSKLDNNKVPCIVIEYYTPPIHLRYKYHGGY